MSQLKVLQLNHTDIVGGAARAAYRIHNAIRDSGIDSRMYVNVATSGDWTVQGPSSKQTKAFARIRPHLSIPLRKLLRTSNPIIHSPAIVPSSWPERINSLDTDLVHLPSPCPPLLYLQPHFLVVLYPLSSLFFLNILENA